MKSVRKPGTDCLSFGGAIGTREQVAGYDSNKDPI